MLLMMNYTMGVEDFISLFMFGVKLLLCFGENGEISCIVVVMIFNELNKLIMMS